jgi:hypothetical protein
VFLRVSLAKANVILDNVPNAISDFEHFARAYDVTSASRDEIGAVLRRHISDLEAASIPKATRAPGAK